MTRLALTENMKRLRLEERRSPVEKALYAFAALFDREKTAVVEQFNSIYGKCIPPQSLAFNKGELT